MHALTVDLGVGADAIDAEILEIGVIDGARQSGAERSSTVPSTRFQGLGPPFTQSRPDQYERLLAASGLTPGREAHDHLLDALNAGRRQRRVLLAARHQRGIVEALGADRHDPEVGARALSSTVAILLSEPR